MEKQNQTKVVAQSLYLLTGQGWLLVRLSMMVVAMFVFMIIMVLHGCKLEEILMEKQQVIRVGSQYLYPLTDQY